MSPEHDPGSRAAETSRASRSGTNNSSRGSAGSFLRLGVLSFGDLRLGVPIEALSEVCTVSRLGPTLVPWRGALGTLDLRGLLVPIFDHAVLTGRRNAAAEALPPYAAILQHGEKLIGIGVDEIEGFIEVAPEALQPITQSRTDGGAALDGRAIDPPRPDHALAGCLKHRGGVVTMVDPAALFAASGLPTALRRKPVGGDRHQTGNDLETLRGTHRNAATSDAGREEPALVFSAGNATFALQASAIHGTVPRSVIDRNALSEGACIGTIVHHGQRVPVMRTAQVMSLGRCDEGREAEIVLVRCGADRRIGLAVDTIKRMLALDMTGLEPAPSGIGRAGRLIAGITTDTTADEQVFVIDADQLVGMPDVAELAALSQPRHRRTGKSPPADVDIKEERTRHIVFHAGTLIATPITQVSRVVQPPRQIVPSPDAVMPGVAGLFSLAGRSVLYVDLARMLGLPLSENSSRMLLVETATSLVGFAVDTVTDIDVSAWRRCDERSGGAIVQLGTGTARRILPAVDLTRLAHSVIQ